MLTLEQWLRQTVQCDEKGGLPSLESIPLEYVSRQEMFNRRIANEQMFDEDIRKRYEQYLELYNMHFKENK